MAKRLAWGVSDVYYIGHGIGEDPEIEYQGHRFDYWEVENALADMVSEDLELDWTDGISANDWEAWVKSNRIAIWSMLDDWIDSSVEAVYNRTAIYRET